MKSKTAALLLALTLLVAPNYSLAQERGFVSSLFCNIFSVFTGADCSAGAEPEDTGAIEADVAPVVSVASPATEPRTSLVSTEAASQVSSGVSLPSLSRSDVQSMIDRALVGLPAAPVILSSPEVRTVETVVYRSSSAQSDSIMDSSARALASLRSDIEEGRVPVPLSAVTGQAETLSGDADLSGLSFANATGTNATTTSFFSTVGRFATGVIDTLSSTLATITTLFTTNLTSTNATSTNLVSLTAPVAPSFVATSTTATSTFAGNLSVGGILTLSQTLSIASGGTGASTAEEARSRLGLAYASNGELATSSITIATWGDSLTQGAGGTAYPTQLTTLSGYSTYNGGVGGQNSTQIKDRMLADSAKHTWPTVIWAGRVNVTATEQTKADIASMVAALGHENYLVLAVTNGERADEHLGEPIYEQIVQLNEDLASIYGDNFIDIRSYLVSLYDSNIAQDVIDFANDIPPSSLRSDEIHFNTTGYLRIAEKINSEIVTLIGDSLDTKKVITSENLAYILNNPTTIGSTTQGVGYFSSLVAGTKTIPFNAFSVHESRSRTVFTGTATGTAILVNSLGTGNYTTLDFGNSGSTAAGVPESRIGSIRTTTGSFLQFGTSNSYLNGITNTAMTISPVGNVGVGTTSPARALQVLRSGEGVGAVQLRLGTSGSTFWDVGRDQGDGDFTISDSGSEKFRIDNNGNVGIGTTAPAERLHVSSSSQPVVRIDSRDADVTTNDVLGAIDFYANDLSANGVGVGARVFATAENPGSWYGLAFSTKDASNGLIERMRVTRDGKVGIGTMAPNVRLEIVGGGGAPTTEATPNGQFVINGVGTTNSLVSMGMDNTGGLPYFWLQSRHATAAASYYSAALNPLGGNVGIGTTSPTAQLTNTGTVRFGALGSAGASLVTDANGNVTVSSDERLKDVQGAFTRGLSDLAGISPVTYRWNATSGLETEGLYTGFSAQNIQANIPEAVGTDSRGFLTLSDRPILAAVVNAIRELSAKVDELMSSQFTYINEASIGVLNAGKINIQGDVCVDGVCVTKEQFKNIFMQNGATVYGSGEYQAPTPSPTPTPEPDPVASSTPVEIIDETGSSTPVDIPEETASTTPEVIVEEPVEESPVEEEVLVSEGVEETDESEEAPVIAP